jgi:hypothetical protein
MQHYAALQQMMEEKHIKTQIAMTGLLGAGLLTLFAVSGSYIDHHAGAPSYLFPHGSNWEMLGPLVGGILLLVTAAQWSHVQRKNNEKMYNDAIRFTLALAFFLLIVSSAATLAHGFGAENGSGHWHQLHGQREKSLFGLLWGGVLTASVVGFAWHGHAGYKEMKAKEGVRQFTGP